MKKTMKRLAITTMALFALLGAGGTIAYASGYITWGGTQDYHQILTNLELIGQRGNELKSEKAVLIQERETLITEYEETNRENEQLLNVIKDKDNQINSLEQQIEALEKRIADGKTTQDMLQQAEKDFKHVREETESVLEGLQNE